MNRLHKYWLILLVLVLLVLPLAACGRQDEPASVAEKFLRAAVANDLADLQETVDPDYQDQVMMSIFLQMGLSAFVGGAQGEYSELKVTTIANDGQRATVRATGKLKVTTLGTQMSVPVDLELPLVKKQGRWYVTEFAASPAASFVTPTPVGVRFLRIVYLGPDDEPRTATSSYLQESRIDRLRCAYENNQEYILSLEGIRTISIMDTRSLEEIESRPSVFSSAGSQIPRTRLKVEYLSGKIEVCSMFDSLYLQFEETIGGKELAFHPSRVQSITFVRD